ncbi:hypothetical protein M3M35_07215 [Fructilactobacillus myrtifloralis]|uniref:Uncharacterized protein n=1 Tax=Fructilactobacillus myrtifloralis TaxID=2940301 RepID=A0ABY5BQ69_9LACO|nr:hypothetical protein [Fructilactobacillus myrtifloralis]USS85071.1 hypothetical protein M3M35_07215 [Fructilactobacillus myrtifloralis]
MPKEAKDWITQLYRTNPNKNCLNLIGDIMEQVRQYQVTPGDQLDIVGQWIMSDPTNVAVDIGYLSSKFND